MREPAKTATLAAILAAFLAFAGPAVLADFDTGMNYFKSGKYVEAAAEFQAIVEASPEYDYGYYILGASFTKMKKYNDAIENYKKAIDLNGDKFEYYYGLAGAYLGSGNYRKVVETLDSAEPLVPDQYRTAFLSMRGKANFALKKYSQAIDDLEAANKAKPSAQTYDQLAKSYYELRHYDKAAAAYKASLKLEPDATQNYMYLSMALSNSAAATKDQTTKTKNYTEALAAAEKYAAKKPNDFEAVNLMGRSALGAKKFEAAVTSFNKALQIKPDYCPAMVNKAKAYIAMENWKAAEPTLQGAVQCDPSMAQTHESLGFVFRKLERLDDSLVEYEKARSIKPSSSIDKAIEEVKHNIDVRDTNILADQKEKEYQEQLAAEKKRQEEEEKKRQEWERRREDN